MTRTTESARCTHPVGPDVRAPDCPATVGDLLTQRRAVDLARTESALCRLPRRPLTPSASPRTARAVPSRKVPSFTMSTSVPETEKRSRFTLPSFGVQVLIGLVLGVVLGLVARSMGADGVDAAGEVDPNWLTETLSTIGGTSSRCCATSSRRWCSSRSSPRSPTCATSPRRATGVADAAWFAVTALIAVASASCWAWSCSPVTTPASPLTRRAPRRTTGSWLDFLTGLVPANVLGLGGVARRRRHACRPVVQRAADPGHRDRHGHRRPQGRRGRRPVPGLRPLGAGDRAEGALVGHPPRPVAHRRPARQRGGHLRLGRPRLARARSPWRSTSAWRWCCSASTRCCCALNGLSVKQFFTGAWPAIQLAFVSRSSVGTLPVTQRVTERNLGVPRAYASFAVPLGATTKMDGCASIYPAISAIFVAQFFGLDLSVTDYLLIAFVSVIGSAATAGLTGADRDADARRCRPWACRWRASACCWPSTRSSTWAARRSTSPARRWCRPSSPSARASWTSMPTTPAARRRRGARTSSRSPKVSDVRAGVRRGRGSRAGILAAASPRSSAG